MYMNLPSCVRREILMEGVYVSQQSEENSIILLSS